MKNLTLLLLLSAFALTSCKKENPTENTPTPIIPVNISTHIVGTWDEVKHLINGQEYSSANKISFFSNGTYTTNNFTYPYHCESDALSSDYGQWQYNSSTKSLKLQTSKSGHSHNSISHNSLLTEIISFKQNEMVVKFKSPDCQSQNVVLTFHR